MSIMKFTGKTDEQIKVIADEALRNLSDDDITDIVTTICEHDELLREQLWKALDLA